MVRSGKIGKKVTYSTIYNLATLILFTVALNSDWSASQITWWGSVAFFGLAFLLKENGTVYFERKYTLWSALFLAICAASIIWADSRSQCISVMKSMIVTTVVLLLLRSSIRYKSDIIRMIYTLVAAITINGVYLLAVNTSMLRAIDTNNNSTANRLGTEGTWNANSIGLMAAIGFLVFLYLFRREKKRRKIIYGFLAVMMVFIALVTGSRKALITVAAGAVIYLWLESQKKRIRTFLVIFAISLLLYYLVTEVPYFYSIIGWRMEALIDGTIGTGELDGSALARKKFIKAALIVFKNYPLLGVGIDCFRFYNVSLTGYQYYAHNNYVELLADLGIVGFAAYYGGYLYLLISFLKNRQDGKSITKILFSIFICILINGYGMVEYNEFLFSLLIMLMFAWFTCEWNESEDVVYG